MIHNKKSCPRQEMVNTSSKKLQGCYAININFDDGYNTCIYSWSSMHELGVYYEKNCADYLKSQFK